MSEWAVADFVSRVAERVTTAGEGLAAQIVDRHADEDDLVTGPLRTAFPRVEPSPDFVRRLQAELGSAPVVVTHPSVAIYADRRVVYGVAVGSLASAAVVAALLLRSRAANRPAA
jgi:hypothetical protein